MVNEHTGTTKFPGKGMPYKYTNVGKYCVPTYYYIFKIGERNVEYYYIDAV